MVTIGIICVLLCVCLCIVGCKHQKQAEIDERNEKLDEVKEKYQPRGRNLNKINAIDSLETLKNSSANDIEMAIANVAPV